MKCPICDGTNLREKFPAEIERPEEVSFSYTFSPAHNKTFRTLRCRDCTHVFCNPIPEGIARYYEDVVDTEYLKHAQSRRLSAQKVLSMTKTIKAGGTLLDVGCATGDLLEVARSEGYEAEGLELSSWSARLAEEKGFKVHQRRLSELAETDAERFDVITLMGVIEHFEKPAEEMKHLARLLKADGVLVLWTGDVDSSLSRVLNRKWWYWQSQHIQYFTHRSLRRLVEDGGLEHRKTRLFPYAATVETISNSLRRYSSHRLLTRLISPFFALKPVWYLRLPGEMLFFAQKVRK